MRTRNEVKEIEGECRSAQGAVESLGCLESEQKCFQSAVCVWISDIFWDFAAAEVSTEAASPCFILILASICWPELPDTVPVAQSYLLNLVKTSVAKKLDFKPQLCTARRGPAEPAPLEWPGPSGSTESACLWWLPTCLLHVDMA